MSDLVTKIDSLNTREDFIEFVELLVLDLKKNPEEWENKSLVSYLDAVASWTQDMDGYFRNNNLPLPKDINWKIFANILIAAKMYE